MSPEFFGACLSRRDRAVAGPISGARRRTTILDCGGSHGEGERSGAVQNGGARVDLNGERAGVVALGGEEIDEIGDAAAIAGQCAVVSGLVVARRATEN